MEFVIVSLPFYEFFERPMEIFTLVAIKQKWI